MHPEKLSFKNEAEIKTKIIKTGRGFISNRPTPKEFLKDIL